ncbi:MAG: hypothetical protein RMA76_28615 [Deltaproteobacteria bacterium]|jgi:DNA-binding beta-propeller fold protein YncE
MKRTWTTQVQRIVGTAGLSLMLGVGAVACKGESTTEQPPPDENQNSAPLTSVEPVAENSDFWSPLDAAPSPDGKIIYFTAMNEDGPAVMSVEPGSQPTVLATGGLLVSPFSIIPSLDGSRLFVVDSGAEGDTEVTGRVFSMSSSGGEPSALSAADGTMPKSLTVAEVDGEERIYFTGVMADDETTPAIFSMLADGTDFNVELSGEPLVDPSGIAVTGNGTIYVADSNADELGNAAIVKVENGAASLLASDLRVGFPAGIALDFEERALFVSGLAKEDSSSLVYHIVLDSKEITRISDGISHNSESAGVHRAHAADVYAWANADGDPSEPSGGTVYLLKGPQAP